MANAEHLLGLIKQSERLKGNDSLRYRNLSPSPFLEGVDPSFPDFEGNPEKINAGDLCMYYWDDWQFIVPNGNQVGNRPLYYTDPSYTSQRPIETEVGYRVAKNLAIPSVTLQSGEAMGKYPVVTGKYLDSLEGVETPLHIVDYSTGIKTDKY